MMMFSRCTSDSQSVGVGRDGYCCCTVPVAEWLGTYRIWYTGLGFRINCFGLRTVHGEYTVRYIVRRDTACGYKKACGRTSTGARGSARTKAWLALENTVYYILMQPNVCNTFCIL